MTKLVSNLSWNDRFALIDHFQPTDDQICNVFGLSTDELSTARSLRDAGTFIPSQHINAEKYNDVFNSTTTPAVSVGKPAKAKTATVHARPLTATKKTAARVPQKRGRKGDKIAKAFQSIPITPVSVEDFMKQHGVSLAVLRQSKRFMEKMDTNVVQSIGKINVKQDKTTKALMIWRETV